MKNQKVKPIDVAKMFIANGWRPNRRYTVSKLDENGFRTSCGSTTGFLIDGDGRYAVTLKRRVITIHDSKRSYCKIISMRYCEMELKSNKLICGKIIFMA